MFAVISLHFLMHVLGLAFTLAHRFTLSIFAIAGLVSLAVATQRLRQRLLRGNRGTRSRSRSSAQPDAVHSTAPVDLDAMLAQSRSPWRCTRAKPTWVVREIIKLQALLPKVGSRKIAEIFNRRNLAQSRESISHSTVRRIVIKHHVELAAMRKALHNRAPPSSPKNNTWAMDLTMVTDVNSTQRIVLGVVDHGTRALLTLSNLADKRSLTVLAELIATMKRFGVPKRIRIDNEPVFTSTLMRLALSWLGVRLQRIQPMSPWQNGRIERFFGTFKESIRKIVINGADDLQTRLVQFRAFYNHVRIHQHLNGRTPAEAWDGVRKRYGDGKFVALWSGVLPGWYFAKRE